MLTQPLQSRQFAHQFKFARECRIPFIVGPFRDFDYQRASRVVVNLIEGL